jgi:Sodium / potassium ATPase beta chain
MPRDLQSFINETSAKEPMAVSFKNLQGAKTVTEFICNFFSQLNTIWVSCEGENPADLENVGPIKYYPRRGFPGFYYPYENSEGYLSPLVAVHFERPVRKLIF